MSSIKKTERIYLRVTPETKLELLKLKKKYNISISSYLIHLIENKKLYIQALPDKNTLKLQNELGIIGKNLWTLIKYNKTLKLTEKISLEKTIYHIKLSLEKINNYYDRKNINR
ncbi:plasmid mobilization protein [Polaribacter cellanae]|uniref:Mobilization protein n=1 Tax=Polaribacter cellanae TaxID=2818493 RepID=A0A975CM30_9FLAO|nr:hypothetical protein [Polaribacter cellanae]QTE21020.1 hypothetical protein J3359_09165 [Polaribacter cellanae]